MSQSVNPSTPPAKSLWKRLSPLWLWVDSDYFPEGPDKEREKPDVIDWRRASSFIFLHIGCLLVFLVGWSWTAVWMAVAAYIVRMFAVTGIYHRYFSHRSYKTSRFGQFLLAVLGNTAVQRGALWWAATHRHHHQHSDDEHDAHSPRQHGFWWAHIGWMTSARNFPTDYKRIKDLARFPELVFLNRFDLLIPALLVGFLYALGATINAIWPQLGTSGWQMVVWVFFISTTFLLHGTLFINSLAHVYGSRRYNTTDDSRNSLLLALITLGEGWHNNHHHCMTTVRQGFYWWEIDITYYILKALSWTGFIWDLRPVPAHAYDPKTQGTKEQVQPVQDEEPALSGLAKLQHEAARLSEAASHKAAQFGEAATHTAEKISEAAKQEAAMISEAAKAAFPTLRPATADGPAAPAPKAEDEKA